MSAISSYSQLPQSVITDDSGNINLQWQLFFSKLASGIVSYIRQVPVTGFSFTIPVGVTNIIFDPAGVLPTGAIVMPASATDGQVISIITSNTVTSVTISANQGQSISNAPTTLTAPGCSFIFSQPVATWYRKT
jgi:hypothetical protein